MKSKKVFVSTRLVVLCSLETKLNKTKIGDQRLSFVRVDLEVVFRGQVETGSTEESIGQGALLSLGLQKGRGIRDLTGLEGLKSNENNFVQDTRKKCF